MGQRFCDGCGQSLANPTPTSVPATSPPEAVSGRYEVKRFLGEGGKKKVYVAHDNVPDRDIALAVIKTEGLDETSRAHITREARAMGRLGDHPHVLPMHDLDEEDGQPYMVQPFMAGGDVEALLENAEDHRLTIEQAMDLATQVICYRRADGSGGHRPDHDRGAVGRTR